MRKLLCMAICLMLTSLQFAPFSAMTTRSNPDREGTTVTTSNNTVDISVIKKRVELHLRLKEPGNAYTQLEQFYKKNKSEIADADLVTLALLVKEIQNLANSEGAIAGISMNFNKVIECTSISVSADTLYKELLFMAAIQGNQDAQFYIGQEAAIANAYRLFQNNNSYNNSTPSYQSHKKVCTLCKGKGWIAGSKSPTYGITSTHWCSECDREVNASHSHDRCPSCSGNGYY